MGRVVEDAVRINSRLDIVLETDVGRTCRMLRIREVVLQYRLLQSLREWMRRRFLLSFRNELL